MKIIAQQSSRGPYLVTTGKEEGFTYSPDRPEATSPIMPIESLIVGGYWTEIDPVYRTDILEFHLIALENTRLLEEERDA